MPGRLIVADGIDGCGKETQISLIRKSLPDAVVFKYPTKNYQMLNDYLEKKISPDPKALFLMFLADIADDQKNVKQALDEGKTVILDRYVFSTISYEVDGVDYDNAKKIVESMGYLRPDLVILLDIDAKTSQERKTKQKALDRYEENAVYLEKVRSNFLKLAEERFLTPNWHTIDASKDIKTVNETIAKYLH